MRTIERKTLEQISGGFLDFFQHLGRIITGTVDDEPDRWIYEEMNYNASLEQSTRR